MVSFPRFETVLADQLRQLQYIITDTHEQEIRISRRLSSAQPECIVPSDYSPRPCYSPSQCSSDRAALNAGKNHRLLMGRSCESIGARAALFPGVSVGRSHVVSLGEPFRVALGEPLPEMLLKERKSGKSYQSDGFASEGFESKGCPEFKAKRSVSVHGTAQSITFETMPRTLSRASDGESSSDIDVLFNSTANSMQTSASRAGKTNTLSAAADLRTMAALLRMASDARLANEREHLSPQLSDWTNCWRTFTSWLQARFAEFAKKDVVIMALDLVMGVLILINCMLVGASLDTEEWSGWQTVDYIFAGIYICELALRLKLLGWRELYRGESWAWSIFDTMVVVFVVVDLFVKLNRSISVIRVVRLGRALGLVRMFRVEAIKELIMLLRGMAGGVRCLFWCLVVLLLPVFITAIFNSQLLKDFEDDTLFASVPKSMFTTIRCMVGDCTDKNGRPIVLLLIDAYGWHIAFAYAVFMLVTIFGVFNLITAIFIESTMQAAKSDIVLQRQIVETSERRFARNIKKLVYMFWQQLRKKDSNTSAHTGSRMTSMSGFHKFDMSDALDMEISQEMYDELIGIPDILEVLDELGLRDDDIVDLFQILDVDQDGKLDLKEIVTGIQKLRGDATKRDLVGLAYVMYGIQDAVRSISSQVSILTGEGCSSRSNNQVSQVSHKSSYVVQDVGAVLI